MATAFRPIKGMDFNFDYSNFSLEAYNKATDEYIARLRKWVMKNTDSKDSIVGEMIRFPVADGYANYMIYRTKPLQLIHVAIGDAWEADRCLIRGLRLQDARGRVKNAKAISKMFGR
ncbi:MAG: hypothetical protein WC119_00785 [Synergistaceae bacterium]